ncbi:MAG TPA: hypothetical protein PK867_27480, partial [Pirellulales bacterium]|nr:hypothetical protein [Pirellulales bacterium]
MAIVTEQRVAPLTAGDQLTRDEFLRRWEADPNIKLAELIEGTVYAPFRNAIEHGDMVGGVADWLSTYHIATAGTAGGRSTTLLMLDDA